MERREPGFGESAAIDVRKSSADDGDGVGVHTMSLTGRGAQASAERCRLGNARVTAR
jgi:hypothetical protein